MDWFLLPALWSILVEISVCSTGPTLLLMVQLSLPSKLGWWQLVSQIVDYISEFPSPRQIAGQDWRDLPFLLFWTIAGVTSDDNIIPSHDLVYQMRWFTRVWCLEPSHETKGWMRTSMSILLEENSNQTAKVLPLLRSPYPLSCGTLWYSISHNIQVKMSKISPFKPSCK